MPSSSTTFESPTVVAVYATYAVLCWQQPRTAHTNTVAEHITWVYQIEYNCSCRARQQPFSITTSDTFALLATPHAGETYYVRVVARATVAGAGAGVISSKVTLTAGGASPTRRDGGACPLVCVFDSLYLAANVAVEDTAALRAARCSATGAAALLDTVSIGHSLESDVAVRAYRMTYGGGVRVLPTSDAAVVYYMVATARQHTGRRTRAMDLLAVMQRDSAAVVFCGIGCDGGLALRAATSFLSSLATACPSMCRSVLCITHGTPRLLLKEGPRLLAHTLSLSEQLWHYTQLPLGDAALLHDGAMALSRRGSGAAAADTPPLGYTGGYYRNTLVGLRCGLVDGARLQFSPSLPDQLMTEAEEAEPQTFDVAGQLRALAALLSPANPRWLAPSVSSVRHCSHGALLHTTVEGTNLHYSPRVTLAPLDPRGGAPLFPRVSSCSPLRLECTTCLLPWLRRAAAGGVQVCVLLHTSIAAAAASTSSVVTLSSDLRALLRAAGEATAPWSAAAAPGLVDCALRLQPLCTLAVTGDTAVNPMVEALCAIASAAEVLVSPAASDGAASSGGGVFKFVNSVAARLSSSSVEARAGAAPVVRVPGVEAAYLQSAVREWRSAGLAAADVWAARCASWQQRVFHGLPSLRDDAYRSTLVRLLRLFDGAAGDDDDDDGSGEPAPLACLEAWLYTHTKYHVSAAQSAPVHMDESLSRELSLTDFYTAVAGVVGAGATAAPGAPLPHLRESLELWAVCHCFELRREMARTTMVCAVGPPGCGMSTLQASLAAVLHGEVVRRSGRQDACSRFILSSIPASRLSALCMAAQSGARCCVLLAAEASDLSTAAYTAMSIRIQEQLTHTGQHLFRLITKADEHLRRGPHLHAELQDEASVAALMTRVGAELVGGCSAEEHRLVVALAPSTSRLSELVGCTLEESERCAGRLRRHAEALLLQCIRLGAAQGGEDAVVEPLQP
ncbi:hypothetical protein NESM_000821200 [Novymonas esmeraldas]|uniref:Fibronectin type-III domain-containing protein n=1 Tax=Novymonas esmeraldas TaxID=1808958 RepID=A0AAW0EX64_9TRYP